MANPATVVCLEHRKSLLSGDVVNFVVGTDDAQTTLHVYERLLRSRTDYFDDDLRMLAEAPATHTIKLQQDDVQTVRRYLSFIGDGHLAVICANGCTNYDAITDLYALGVKLRDASLQNTALDAWLTGTRATVQWTEDRQIQLYPTVLGINRAWAATLPNSPYRRLLVHRYATLAVLSELMNPANIRDYNQEFVAAVLMEKMALCERGEGGGRTHAAMLAGDASAYHVPDNRGSRGVHVS